MTETDAPVFLVDQQLQRGERAATETELPLNLVDQKLVLDMLHGEDQDDIDIGRVSGFNLDPSEFDALPAFEADISPEQASDAELYTGSNPTATATTVTGDDESDDEDGIAEPFSPPPVEPFPLYKRALQYFRSEAAPTRVARIDTDATYNDFVGEKAIKELARRLTELRAYVEAHVRDMGAHNSWSPPETPLSDWGEVIGAAESVNSLRAATTADEAVRSMPEVPLDLPDFAQGKVKCWRDGDDVVVSLRFCAADGTPRYASMAARPRVDAEDIVGWAMRSGAHPVTVLGIAQDLAASACGKKLVRDAAAAALQSQRRLDVVGMTVDGDEAEPILLTNGGEEDTAPLAALMHVQQLAEAGDEQACREMGIIRAAASTPEGQLVAAPVLEESTRKLAEGRRQKREEVVGGCWR